MVAAGLACAVLGLVMPALALAQSTPQQIKPPQAAPAPEQPRTEAQPPPNVQPAQPGAGDEEEEDERADGIPPSEGCPFRGNKLELIV